MIVIGGGPAGFMGAITAAEQGVTSVFVCESTSKTLEKVRLSGGGRCNVTHASWDPIDLVNNYPRGRSSLFGVFSRFATADAVTWFAEKGLDLVAERDGRMFPVSNSSLEVVACLRRTAKVAGVHCLRKSAVYRVDYLKEKGFLIYLQGREPIKTKKVLIATGGHPSGRKLASNLGHTIVDPAPSLFSFKLDAFPLKVCSGVALDDISLKLVVGGKSFKEKGRVLITHVGLSGPSILRLSAFAARELHKNRYKAQLIINWIDSNYLLASELLNTCRFQLSRKSIGKANPFKKLPRRLWLIILKTININPLMRWAELSSLLEKRLLDLLLCSSYTVCGKGPFGEEFVTAGGVNLREVNFATMESRIASGLYFAGELLDVDGVTGGFNFQHCWSSGWLAGKAIANSLNSSIQD